LASSVISAQIERDVIQPCDKLGGRPKFSDVEVSANESLLRQFNGVSFAGNVAKDKTEDPFLVPMY
jgi:hypothetical protein